MLRLQLLYSKGSTVQYYDLIPYQLSGVTEIENQANYLLQLEDLRLY